MLHVRDVIAPMRASARDQGATRRDDPRDSARRARDDDETPELGPQVMALQERAGPPADVVSASQVATAIIGRPASSPMRDALRWLSTPGHFAGHASGGVPVYRRPPLPLERRAVAAVRAEAEERLAAAAELLGPASVASRKKFILDLALLVKNPPKGEDLQDEMDAAVAFLEPLPLICFSAALLRPVVRACRGWWVRGAELEEHLEPYAAAMRQVAAQMRRLLAALEEGGAPALEASKAPNAPTPEMVEADLAGYAAQVAKGLSVTRQVRAYRARMRRDFPELAERFDSRFARLEAAFGAEEPEEVPAERPKPALVPSSLDDDPLVRRARAKSHQPSA